MTEGLGVPHADAERITEDQIHAVVVEFYRRARRDDRLGPVFEEHVEGWDGHLARMTDFWSAALLRSGRYSGRPVGQHRAICGLGLGHFDRWIELFEATLHDLCADHEAEAFLVRARRMRDAMTKVLGIISECTCPTPILAGGR
jgi:hemoglobin